MGPTAGTPHASRCFPSRSDVRVFGSVDLYRTTPTRTTGFSCRFAEAALRFRLRFSGEHLQANTPIPAAKVRKASPFRVATGQSVPVGVGQLLDGGVVLPGCRPFFQQFDLGLDLLAGIIGRIQHMPLQASA